MRKKKPGRKVDLPAWFLVLLTWALHHMAHEVSHGFRRLILHLAGGVGVGAQSETCVIVAQHTGDRFDVHSVLQGQGGERMSEVVEANVF